MRMKGGGLRFANPPSGSLKKSVIPGRCAASHLESIGPDARVNFRRDQRGECEISPETIPRHSGIAEGGTRNPRISVSLVSRWIPGLREGARPGMTALFGSVSPPPKTRKPASPELLADAGSRTRGTDVPEGLEERRAGQVRAMCLSQVGLLKFSPALPALLR
jgi:hypothetical protein